MGFRKTEYAHNMYTLKSTDQSTNRRGITNQHKNNTMHLILGNTK